MYMLAQNEIFLHRTAVVLIGKQRVAVKGAGWLQQVLEITLFCLYTYSQYPFNIVLIFRRFFSYYVYNHCSAVCTDTCDALKWLQIVITNK